MKKIVKSDSRRSSEFLYGAILSTINEMSPKLGITDPAMIVGCLELAKDTIISSSRQEA